jgi:hypothetical protein
MHYFGRLLVSLVIDLRQLRVRQVENEQGNFPKNKSAPLKIYYFQARLPFVLAGRP